MAREISSELGLPDIVRNWPVTEKEWSSIVVGQDYQIKGSKETGAIVGKYHGHGARIDNCMSKSEQNCKGCQFFAKCPAAAR